MRKYVIVAIIVIAVAAGAAFCVPAVRSHAA
jgi:hypothetical protein